MTSPIITGGNGHSGTRVFAQILKDSGVYMGVPGLSYYRNSRDLKIIGLMSRWMKPYLLGLNAEQTRKMQREFRFRLRLLLPLRSRPWGFKNPRSMFLLPFYHQMFPDMRFIHVIRDGRDMCLGNPFIKTPTYWGLLPDEDYNSLTPEERMMIVWGESNRRTRDYGERELGQRYLRVRFEDLCANPQEETRRIVEFIDGPLERVPYLASLVKKPRSIGRWREFGSGEVEKVLALGQGYLAEFGYTGPDAAAR